MHASDTDRDTEHPALHPATVRCLRSCSSVDHAKAEQLRSRSAGEHNRNQKRRARRLRVASSLIAALSFELAWEGR